MVGLFAPLLAIGLGASAPATGIEQTRQPDEQDAALASKTMDEAFYPNDESFKRLADVKRYYAARYKAQPRP